jgi:raffinose/stachyose/melibiose transport system permease protein
MDIMIYKKKSPALFFLFPAFFFLGMFLYYPFVLNIINSFQEITSMGSAAEGNIGITNYVNLFRDPNIAVALKNTVIMIFASVVFQVGFALVLALMVDNITKFAQFYRTVFFFPIVISGTALGMLFNLLYVYHPSDYAFNGVFNQIIMSLGGSPVHWFSPKTCVYYLLVPIVWQYVGFYFVILLTGLNNISTDVYESASIDGATGLKKIWYISLPLIQSVWTTCVTLAITGALKVFDLPWIILPRGIPNGKSFFTGTYMYYMTFEIKNYDYGATIAIMIVVLGVVISSLTNMIIKPKEY